MAPSFTRVQVWESVERITAPNPGPKTLDGTNLYLVGSSPRYLIDAGPDEPEFLHALADELQGTVDAILLTHSHPDHAAGAATLRRLLNVPLYLSAEAMDALPPDDGFRALAKDQTFDAGGQTLRSIPMPGHADDHVCFFLEPDRLLFSGDNILGRGTTLIAKPEGDMVIYMDTLHRTRELNPVAIAPGHGPMILNPEAVIDEYVHHRQERERELLAALDAPQTVWELVDRIYSPPSEPIRQLASLSVEAQLAKLESERRVERLADGRYLIRADS